MITRSIETSSRSNDLLTRLVKASIRSNDLLTRSIKTSNRSNDLLTRLLKTIQPFERLAHPFHKHINDFLNTEISWVSLVHSSYFKENPLNEIFKTAACTEITTMLFWRPEFALIKVSNITDAWKVSHAFVMHAWCKSCACFRRLRSLLVLKFGLHFPINMLVFLTFGFTLRLHCTVVLIRIFAC